MPHNTHPTPQYIYLLTEGERYEGSTVLSAHATLAGARAAAADHIAYHASLYSNDPNPAPRYQPSTNRKNYWTSGCDILTIDKERLLS